MEWPIRLIFFNPLPNAFELSFLIKTIFSIICIFIIVFALLVHQRILSFLKNNDNRHVDQIIAYQSRLNCFLIPINLSWLLGLQWFGEMQQFVSPQGCYIGSFLGILPMVSVRLWNFKDGGSYKAKFLAKNQYTQRKPWYFETTGSASSSKIGHDFRK